MRNLAMVVALVLALTSIVYGGEGDKVDGLVVFKNDWFFPKEGKDFSVQALCTYFHWKYLGGGFDLRYRGKGDDFVEFQPYLTLNKGPWYVLGGFSVDNQHTKYVQTGGWYINNFGKLNVAVDVRNWWSLDSDRAKSYIDPFLQLLYPLPKPFNTSDEKFFGGVELEWVHWWSGDSHNWYMAGPVVGYKITKNLSTFVRYSSDWDVLKGETSRADRIRIGVSISF